MDKKRFRANFDVSIYDSETEEYISASGRGLEEIAKIMNEQQATIQSLQSDLNKTLDDDDMVLIKRLNNIYDNEGFDGVVDYAKSHLCSGGLVREENGLICMVTAGWSENELFIYNLNHFMSKFHYHLVCTQRGGAFYYSPNKYDDIEVRRVTD